MILVNSTLVHKPVESDIKRLVHDLINKKYGFSFLPEKIICMTNGIEYYFIETEGSDGSKYIINAYGSEALELLELLDLQSASFSREEWENQPLNELETEPGPPARQVAGPHLLRPHVGERLPSVRAQRACYRIAA